MNLRFPGHETAVQKDGLPEGWCRERLDQALFLQRGFDLPNGARVAGDIPVYASTGVGGFHNEARVKGPGVVTGRSGTLGGVRYVPEDYWPLNTVLWVKEFRRVRPIVAFFMLSELNLAQFNSGASVPTLDRKVVHAEWVTIPPVEVMTLFEQYAEPVFKQLTTLQNANTQAARARDELLPKLMSGAIRV